MITNVLDYLDYIDDLNRIAVADENESYTYLELIHKAKKLATYIASYGFAKQPIAVLIDRNAMSIITFYGIVFSGNFYVPIDPTMPKERINMIFSTLQPKLVLSACNKDSFDSIKSNVWDDININEDMLSSIHNNSLDTDPLYAIFTSGSTGVPKGVLINHRSVIDLIEQFSETFPFPENLTIGNQAPLDFDVSTKDIYCSLKLGGTVQVIPKKLFSVPGNLLPYLIDRKVNTIIWAVSAMRIVSDFHILDLYDMKQLKLVMFSGEVMPVKSLNEWMQHLPHTTFVNLYGPTEITCNCTYYIIDRSYDVNENLPIGRSFKNSEVFLLDGNSLIEKDNSIGEICVKGTCLSPGYYNDIERTKQAFVQNPLNNKYPEIIYRTGDLGFFKAGLLYFASRKDSQIKHMGHRIELGEIEVAVNSISFIDIGVCIYDSLNEKIVLFYQAKEKCDKEIIKELVNKLPKYMWPQKLIQYDVLPMNKNGKIDRVLLKNKLIEKE